LTTRRIREWTRGTVKKTLVTVRASRKPLTLARRLGELTDHCTEGVRGRAPAHCLSVKLPLPQSVSVALCSRYTVGMVPPSMTISVPVIADARSEATNATSSATSSGRFGRPRGMPPSMSINRSRAVA